MHKGVGLVHCADISAGCGRLRGPSRALKRSGTITIVALQHFFSSLLSTDPVLSSDSHDSSRLQSSPQGKCRTLAIRKRKNQKSPSAQEVRGGEVGEELEAKKQPKRALPQSSYPDPACSKDPTKMCIGGQRALPCTPNLSTSFDATRIVRSLESGDYWRPGEIVSRDAISTYSTLELGKERMIERTTKILRLC
jgi:hypothetical protein